MPKRFDPNSGKWFDENGDFASPPPEALNKSFDPNQGQWRYKKGHPKAGAYAPSPEPEIVPWSHRDKQNRYIRKDTDEVVSKSEVNSFKQSLPDSLSKKERQKKVRKEFSPAWVNPKKDTLIKQHDAISRNRNIERAQIFKNWAAGENTTITYQDLQQKFKGIPTEEIRGEFIAIDDETGEVNYAPPSERVNEILLEIADEYGDALADPRQFIETP